VRVPLPRLPGPKAGDSEHRVRTARRLDVLLAAGVLLLAFLLASFPARNSDLWLHLAAGRLIAQRDYHFGVDPFAHTTQGAYWVNHSWLFDLSIYGIYQVLGGTGLVALKALLASLLAGVMLSLGARGGSLWAAAIATALAMLAIGPRMLIQPASLSYLFLALTLCFLEYRLEAGEESSNPGRLKSLAGYWPLGLLFALWVNLDSWFLLGPLVTALYWLGESLPGWMGTAAPQAGPSQPRRRLPGAVVVAGLAMCLLNPHHVYAFVLPPQLGLSGAGAALASEPLFQRLFLSPFGAAYLRLGWNVANVVYFLLLGLGLLSFALNRRRRRWSWGLVWVALALLSIYQARNIPLFAVAAGPLLALNFQEWAFDRQRERAKRPGHLPESGVAVSLAGRLATLAICLALAVAAWPGWLQGAPYEPRRWTAEPDASFEQMATQFRQWRREGKRGLANGFNASSEAANYFAWLCPEEKAFFDSRYQPFADATTADYLVVWRAVVAGTPEPEDWRAALRRRNVDHLILYDTDLARLVAPARRLLADRREWTLLYLGGHCAVLGWLDPAKPGQRERFAGLHRDLNQQALHPLAQEQAPRQGPGRGPEPRAWWDAFWTPPAPHAVAADEAALHVSHFDALRRDYQNRHLGAWYTSQAAAVAGLAGPGEFSDLVPWSVRLCLAGSPLAGDSAAGAGLAGFAQGLRNRYVAQQDDGPPTLLWLAVRACRRALQANPDDAGVYLALGEAYLRLAQNTQERAWEAGFPLLGQLRRVQAVVALHQALAARPDLAPVHRDLAVLYQAQGYYDLALTHLKEFTRASRAAGAYPDETAEQFANRLGPFEQQRDLLEREVARLLSDYEVQALNLKVYERARLAQGKGLARKALEVLAGSDVAAYGTSGVLLELELLLTTGRAREVRQRLDAEVKPALRADAYRWLEIRLAAAAGDYDEADHALQEMVYSSVQIPELKQQLPIRGAMALMLGQAIAGSCLVEPSPADWLERPLTRQDLVNRAQNLALLLRQGADLTVLRGLLDLESGRMDNAEKSFRDVLSLWGSEAEASLGAGLDFAGRTLAQRYLRLLQSQGERAQE
jgi:tetratricopeptide (TPR) repeat protein